MRPPAGGIGQSVKGARIWGVRGKGDASAAEQGLTDSPPGASSNWHLTRHNADLDRLASMAALPGGTGDDRFAGEQAALRRVATLVARGAPPEEVFAAVAEEAGRLLCCQHTMIGRYDPDGARTVVAVRTRTGAGVPVGNRASLGGRNVATLVFQTRR